jgi:retron-type reverse transcriptase
MRITFNHSYNDIISIENLLLAWKEFKKGKKSRIDVQIFERNFMSNILSLHQELVTRVYKHGAYLAFNISDPKPRNIHKASVRDRLLHHAIYRILYPFFDRTFTPDLYSCRVNKGTHRALRRFEHFSRKVSKNHTKTCWVLKCDIRKFFASIDQKILLDILDSYISDKDIVLLLTTVIESFHSTEVGKGLPLGNLTSQLFVNIYMNEFDQFVKHRLKAKYYIRYADDFVIISEKKSYLEIARQKVEDFLTHRLKLSLHPDKVSIETFASGIDFLGWVHFPKYRVLRTATKRKMFARVSEKNITSYLGLLSHGSAYNLRLRLLDKIKKSHV